MLNRQLEERFQECSKKGVFIATSVEMLEVDLRPRTQEMKEKARRKKCDVRFSLIRKNRVFQKNRMRTGARQLLRTGLVPARAW